MILNDKKGRFGSFSAAGKGSAQKYNAFTKKNRRKKAKIYNPFDHHNLKEKAGDKTTTEKISNNVVGFKSESRNYLEVVQEIKALGQSLAAQGKLNNATAIVNNRLGKDDNGLQRTLDIMTQENVEMLETIILELKKL